MQSRLSESLYEVYSSRPSVHGFAKNRSIVTNAQRHLDKTYVFNVDLKDFFTSIHFGRVKNLFMARPFNFNHTVSTILAHICCHENNLPQGAPTSPIISNMICWKMDAELQRLAKTTNSTYTRYADDITFSFTCSIRRLPEDVVVLREGEAGPGHALAEIVVRNGFEFNYDKIRLSGKSQRMEVTGVTVNEFPNVKRKYIRQISSILYAWEKFGYESAEDEFNSRYDVGQRASDSPKFLRHVVRGKLSFVRTVRGGRDPVFQKLAARYNALVEDEELKFHIVEETAPEQAAIDSLWVLEVCYDSEDGEPMCSQGTGFILDGYGLVTCAHVVSHQKKVLNEVIAHKWDRTSHKIELIVTHIDFHRDIAICKLKVDFDLPSIRLFDQEVELGMAGRLLGFPAYKVGQTAYICDAKVASKYVQSCVHKFEINQQIREGNSGGPVVNAKGELLGVALEGAKKDSGNNAVLECRELSNVLSDEYRLC